MVARVVPQSARRRHAESRKPDLRGVVARPKAPVLLPESGAALRAAALALSAKAIAIQAQRLKELRAASQIN